MNCDWVKANIVLYVYDELADDARFELEQHVRRCMECAAELDLASGFRTTVSALPVVEPSPNLLTASRLRLQEALETTEQHRGWRRLVLEPAKWLPQLKLAPALVALIFLVGFGAGMGASYRLTGGGSPIPGISGNPASAAGVATSAAEASIMGITAINQQPGSKHVDVRYEALVPQSVSGSIDDPRIQQLLLFAARNNANSGVRMDSVDLLTQKPEDEQVREALVYALRYDSNPGVRLKSLEGLGPYVKGDIRVRDAVLDALMNDRNPGVRTEAIQMLRSVRADASVREVLQHLAGQDQNLSIRNLSRSVLASTPPID
jgi:hypothetical protein